MTGSKLLQKTSCYSSEIPINFAEKGKGKQKTCIEFSKTCKNICTCSRTISWMFAINACIHHYS